MKTWEIYDPNHRKLSEILSANDIMVIREAAKMRNNLVHGEGVYNLNICKEETKKVLNTLNNIKIKFDSEYGYYGWSNIAVRKISVLHSNPKVKIHS